MPPLLRALIVVNVLLVGALVLAWQWSPAFWQPPAALRPDPESLQPVTIDRAAPQADAMSAMVERPLFDPDRRRHAIVADGPRAAPAETLSATTLLGIVQAEHGGSAIVRVDGIVRRLHPGERIGPWTLVGVSEATARFIGNGGQSWELSLQRAGQPRRRVEPSAAQRTPAAAAAAATPPAAVDGGEIAASEDPIMSKSFEERVAERRARREAMQQRIDR